MQRSTRPSARPAKARYVHQLRRYVRIPFARAGRAVAVAACLGSLATAQLLVFAAVGAPPAAAATDPVLMAAGDVGCDPTTNTPANCPMNDTAALINSAKPGYVLALGDIQYTDNLPPGSPPTPSMYLQGYDSAWGQIPASVPGVSINPVAGNHDWADPNDTNSSSGATLANYISYFNSKGQLRSDVTASTPWYSFNIPVSGGSWHVIMLDNECGSDGGCGAGSAQETFLRNDLAANPGVCTIAAWHRPRFSSGAIGNRSEYAQFWTDLSNAHASVVMAGSDHDYERFNPQTPGQVASPTGIAQYVVGTGGAFLPGNFGTVQPNSAFRDASHWGVLKMTLHAGSYDHAFVTTSGSTLDAGTVNCSSTPTAPAVSGLSPTTGPAAGGNSVVISGTNFTGATSVKFGTVAATGVTVNSATQITVTAPAGTAGTSVDVTVVTPSGTSITNTSDRYAYQTTQPQVNSVSPPSGPAAGGTSVTISGINLSGATGVKFGTTPAASFTAVSGTQVTAVSPPGTDQTSVDVTVTTPVATSATGPGDRFTYGTITTPPTVAAVTPISGPSTGGNSVSITGSSFTGASAVKFGTAAAASFTVGNAGLITAIPPAGTANLLDVTVTNLAGTSATGTADQYSYTFSNNGYAVSLSASTAAPAVGAAVNLTATANKDVGPTPYGLGIVDVTAGTELVHAGSGATLSTSVTQASAVSHRYMGYISNASMANAQANSTPVVVAWGGSTTPPSVSAIAPSSGPAAGGTPVTITGANFTGATAVKFGTTNASFTVGSATSISATAPAGPAGAVDVTVTTPAGTSPVVAADKFTYAPAVPAPAVTGISPASGTTAGDTSVVISGTNFSGATGVSFGATAATFTVTSATSVTAVAPAGTAGTVDVTVTTPGGTSAVTTADHFTYVPPVPTVTGISPASGSTAGGTSVVITGTGFTGVSAVKFGTATAATFTANSATQITATAPSAGAGPVDITVTTPGGTSATSAADVFTYVTPAPVVTGVSPTTGSTAGGATVTISGTNFNGATGVSFGATAATFTVNSTTSITATSPAAPAGQVDVTVTTPAGTSALVAADKFTYVTPPSPPTVTGISPASGTTAGGTSVVISGTNFSGATGVSFGAAAATAFTVNSATQITATSPAGAPGAVHVTVTNLGGTSPAGSADVFTFVTPPPAVTGVSPNSGPASGGASVVITGTTFTGATGVSFGAVPAASFTFNSASQITAVAPAGSGQVDITVTTPAGTSAVVAADKFTYIPPPSVTGVSPVTGTAAGGTSVVITGANLTGATSVKFGAANAASFAVNNAGQINAVSPSGAPGTVDITVTTPAGTSATSGADQFMFVTPPPAVSSVSPNTGPTAGGTVVTIGGSNFTPGTPVVNFGATAGSVTAFSATSITVTAPAGAGVVDITVTTPGGTSPVTTADHFTYADVTGPPTVSGVTPIYGPSTGGTSVVITGTNFASVSSVQFGSVAATGFTVNSTTQITATAPAGTTTVDVTVVTSKGTSARNTATDQYTYTFSNNGYAVSLAASTAAPAVGAAVNITVTANKDVGPTPYGLSIIDVTTGVEVFHGGSGASASVSIMQTTAGPHRYVGFVSNAGGANAQAASVPVVVFWGGTLPTVTGVSPASGSTAGGTSVSITGTNLTGATAVRFGATNATAFTVNSATSITATAPAAAAGAVDVTVTTPTGTSATGAGDQFTYQTPAGPPTVGGVAPAQGPLAGGTAVTITGTGFTGASAVAFGASPATSFSVGSPTSITATAPAGSAGTVHISVTNGVGTSSPVAADQFTYLATPAVTGVAPASGPAGGGTSVVITGSAFTGATAVSFGAVSASAFTVNSATSITATSPAAAAAGPVDVTVTTPGGTSSAGGADQFTYVQAAPAVTSVSPATGSTGGGTVVTITGTNFTPGTPTVAFGANAGSVTAFNATSITVTAPAGAAGAVDVRVTTPAGTSPVTAGDQFTYATGNPGPPTITGTTPLSGPSTGGTSVVITGTNFLNATSVQFGSVNATSYTVNSPTQITATAPAGTTTVDVTVVTPQGTSAHGALDEYTYTFSNNGYSITLSASTTSPAVGGSVVLTATANKDVGPTPYGISIIDVTTGTELVHVGSGASTTATVSNAASTHRYVAMVSNALGANAQAASTPVVVTWH